MKLTQLYYEEKECSCGISFHVYFVVVAVALTNTFVFTFMGHCNSLAFLSVSGTTS